MNLINETFNINKKILPTLKEIKNIIYTDNERFERMLFEKRMDTWEIRDEYTNNNFFILSHEFILSFKNMIEELKIDKIVELHSGIGWFTLWLKKYNISIFNCIDNMTWIHFKNRYLNHVKKEDSIKYVENNSEVKMFILSWPYMDNTACRIWEAMKKGQYLFYIGEDQGGCTANDSFFKVVNGKELDDKWDLNKNFISFWGIHDRANLYKK